MWSYTFFNFPIMVMSLSITGFLSSTALVIFAKVSAFKTTQFASIGICVGANHSPNIECIKALSSPEGYMSITSFICIFFHFSNVPLIIL
ncbi:hypothetical protein CFSAN002367_25164 [Clostridium botulinum CFSAN002367]|nr:hypothetical protein CFSAN002367_25164 [Clostridium botulinum CFSAN002367]EPS50589.1 hypothetical protein CFSAN002369_05826 [Clostridium botulinum CFSAN002369]